MIEILPDISEYYVGEKADLEEAAWNRDKPHAGYASHIHAAMDKFDLSKVIELGCGSGMVAKELLPHALYLGVDRNPVFLGLARSKNPDRIFIDEDIRLVDKNPVFATMAPFDISTSWAVLKHFGLHEWDEIYGKMLSLARYSVHLIDLSTEDIDDGVDFHHTSVLESRAMKVIKGAGHEVVSTVLNLQGTLRDGQPLKTVVITTKKV